jgi:hypothetical protein
MNTNSTSGFVFIGSIIQDVVSAGHAGAASRFVHPIAKRAGPKLCKARSGIGTRRSKKCPSTALR